MRICMVCSGMTVSGVFSGFKPILEQYSELGYEIDIYSFGMVDPSFYMGLNNVRIIDLGPPSHFRMLYIMLKNHTLVKKIRYEINKNYQYTRYAQKNYQCYVNALPKTDISYDVAIAMAEFMPVYYVANKIQATKKICWLHPRWDLLELDFDTEVGYLELMDTIVTVSQDCKNALIKIYPSFQKKIVVIRNIINKESIVMKSNDLMNYKWGDGVRIISVCRLDNHSKRIDRMIEAASKLKKTGFIFQWVIIGDGADREYLEKIKEKKELSEVFHFIGERRNPFPYIKSADIFVLSSQYEGFPVSVTEAIALGITVIASNCIDWDEDYKRNINIIDNNDDVIIDQLVETILRYPDINKVKEVTSIFEFNKERKILLDIIGG